jgi:hypothetical protein
MSQRVCAAQQRARVIAQHSSSRIYRARFAISKLDKANTRNPHSAWVSCTHIALMMIATMIVAMRANMPLQCVFEPRATSFPPSKFFCANCSANAPIAAFDARTRRIERQVIRVESDRRETMESETSARSADAELALEQTVDRLRVGFAA